MRLALTGIILLLLAAIGAWVVNDPAPEIEETAEGVERIEGKFNPSHSITRVVNAEHNPVGQAADGNREKHQVVKVSALQSCLELESFKDCIFGIDLVTVSPKEVARILELAHITQWARTYFLSQVLVVHGPSDLQEFCEEVFNSMSGRFNERASWFESAVHLLNGTNREWLNQIGDGVVAREIFSEGNSDLLVVFLSNIENKSEQLNQTLRRGAQGEFGGTPSQVSRAYLLYMNGLILESPKEAFHFAEGILDSPHLSSEASYSIAQDSLFCVARISKSEEVGSEKVEDYLNSLLRSPRFQVGFAAQFLADYSTHPFPGLDERVSSEIRRESQRVIDSRNK